MTQKFSKNTQKSLENLEKRLNEKNEFEIYKVAETV